MSLRKKLVLTALLLYWPAIFVATHLPIPKLVQQAGVSDKILHFVAYFVLVFLFWFTIIPERKVSWRKTAPWWILLTVVCYGLIDEVLQIYVGRNYDTTDFLANLTGAGAGLILFTFFSFWPALITVITSSIFLLANVAQTDITQLIPVGSLIFYISTYCLLTLVWMHCLRMYFSIRPHGLKWLLAAAALPIALLINVEIFSLLLERGLKIARIVYSASGFMIPLALAVVSNYLLFDKQRKTSSCTFERSV